MTNLNIENRTLGQIVWKITRNGNWSTVTIEKIGKLNVTCSDGNVYGLRQGETEGDLKGEKDGQSITTADKTENIRIQKSDAEKKTLVTSIKNFNLGDVSIETLRQIEALLNKN